MAVLSNFLAVYTMSPTTIKVPKRTAVNCYLVNTILYIFLIERVNAKQIKILQNNLFPSCTLSVDYTVCYTMLKTKYIIIKKKPQYEVSQGKGLLRHQITSGLQYQISDDLIWLCKGCCLRC